ncbi:MAG TPA: LysE family transporter [Chitinophagaceae bacterium]|nr:LysE family transporter [Chitinophagaceae bacterium]
MKIFITGLSISFLGSLPLGTLNVAAMQIAISDGYTEAILFSLGSLLVEMIYVRFSLIGIDWIRKQKKIFKILEWVTLAIVLALAISSFYAAIHPKSGSNIILSSKLPRFVLGAAMCAVNPVQIPFWFGWSTVLFTKKVLLPQNSHYNSYIVGIGIGTFIGNCVFIFGGQLVAAKLNSNQSILSWVIGGIFSLTAIIQAWRIFKNKDAVHNLEHPEEVSQKLEKRYNLRHDEHGETPHNKN